MREVWTISDPTGELGEKWLKEYNQKLMDPNREFGTSALNYKLPTKRKSKNGTNPKTSPVSKE